MPVVGDVAEVAAEPLGQRGQVDRVRVLTRCGPIQDVRLHLRDRIGVDVVLLEGLDAGLDDLIELFRGQGSIAVADLDEIDYQLVQPNGPDCGGDNLQATVYVQVND